MEFTSIVENAALINPHITEIFDKFIKKDNDDDKLVDLDSLDVDELEELLATEYQQ